MQFMDENRTWKRVETCNTAKPVTLPACGASHKPPNCFTTKRTDATSFAQCNVSKRRRQTITLAHPAPAGRPARRGVTTPGTSATPEVFNGVDQKALQACMEQDPDSCLETVPGLVGCVVISRTCNAAVLPGSPQPYPSPQRDGIGDEPASADVRERAASAFAVSPSGVTVTAGPAARAALSPAACGNDEVWTVSSSQSTPGLQRSDRLFDGFTARYDAVTGSLPDACWAQVCEQ